MAIKIDINAWSFQDYARFQDSLMAGRFIRVASEISKIIVEWDYDADVSEGVMSLPTVKDANDVVRTVIDQFNEKIESIGFTDVVVDLSWTPRQFAEFERNKERKNWKRVEAMIHEVASLPGTNEGTALSAVEGLRMLRAINQSYVDSVSGNY